MYIHLGDTGRRSGNLRPKLMGNSFVRLNANCQHIWFGTAAESAVEEMCRRLLEDNLNLRYTSVESLSGSEVERDTRPPPVLKLKSNCGVGLRVRLRVDTVFLPISDDSPSIDLARAILPPHRSFGSDRLDRAPHF